MNVFSRSINRMLVPTLAAGLFLGGVSASQAQINFDYSATYAGLTTSTVYNGGSGGTFTVAPAQDLVTLRNAAGLGATIHLVNNAVGTSEFATSTTISTVTASDNFVVTIFQQGGGSNTFTVPLAINAQFNAGTNNAQPVTSSFTTASFVIGVDTYTINAFQATTPGAPPIGGGSSPIPGDISIHVSATGTPTPEPSAIAMLVGMGVSGSAFVLRRRRATK